MGEIKFMGKKRGGGKRSVVDEVIEGHFPREEAILLFEGILEDSKKPLPFREVQKFVSRIASRTRYGEKLDRETTFRLWAKTAGNKAYAPEQRMQLAALFPAENFSIVATRELFEMLMGIEPVDGELKRTFASHLLRGEACRFPPWASVDKSELVEALLNVELDEEIVRKIPQEKIGDFFIQYAELEALRKYYPPVAMPLAASQYAAMWLCLLSDDPRKEIESIFREAGSAEKYHRGPIYLGLVEAVYRLRGKLDPEFVGKMFGRFRGMGDGAVRKNAYKYGYEIFGPEYIQGALRDSNSVVRRWAEGFVERGGKASKGGRKKRGDGKDPSELDY